MVKSAKKTTTKKHKITDTILSEDVSFYCCDGTRLYSLHDLSSALADMNDGVFAYHVTPTKNDFHNWIKDVFKAEELAMSVLKAKSAKEMKKAIEKAI
jgi:hypothetical protein